MPDNFIRDNSQFFIEPFKDNYPGGFSGFHSDRISKKKPHVYYIKKLTPVI